ncbi:hypothetical protein IFM89_028697 [Coptis chinensis]|uniref:O-fucosyltransferase family protein n=1 Tax=Coptis chinensis TaxID=261450 RepID=A0A835LWV9_9MAGN|nr:hypothetical protein IFM89_028697 [Coptis chinensis]
MSTQAHTRCNRELVLDQDETPFLYSGVFGEGVESQESNRYITVRCNGGLNQMRTGISDMVVVACIMNATLVVPQLDKKSFWKDSRARKHFTSWSDQNYYKEMEQLWKDYQGGLGYSVNCRCECCKNAFDGLPKPFNHISFQNTGSTPEGEETKASEKNG